MRQVQHYYDEYLRTLNHNCFMQMKLSNLVKYSATMYLDSPTC